MQEFKIQAHQNKKYNSSKKSGLASAEDYQKAFKK